MAHPLIVMLYTRYNTKLQYLIFDAERWSRTTTQNPSSFDDRFWRYADLLCRL